MRKVQTRKLFISIFLFFILPSFFIFAEWIGPKKIIEGKWGPEIGEFYFEHQDTSDAFPQKFGVDKNDNIIISDEGNKRIYAFKPNGKLMNIIQKPVELAESDIVFDMWPIEMGLFQYNNIIAFRCAYKQISGGYHSETRCLMSYNGKILNKIELTEIYPFLDTYFLLKKDKYYHYSSTGQLLKVYENKPLERGVIKEESLGNKKYKVIVRYPDKTWEMIQEYGACPEYKRDACSNLYCGTGRFSSTGENLAPNEIIPQNKLEETPISTEYDLGTRIKWIEEYGEPVLSPMGDIYTWKRTPDKYSILKWVWVDGPECPQYLDVTPTKNSLKFT